ncbi:MAG TPA: TolC family protein [Bryobacteraceae bacterium]|nr:TolC family protein [Bryobacteraceae bacterium]
MTVLRAVMVLTGTLFPLLAQFNGSTPTGEASPAPLNLSLDDAIARGLKTNLGLLTRDNSAVSARVDRMRLLAELLPTVDGNVSMSEQQVSLTTFGFRFPGVPTIIGPFHYQDAGAKADVPLFDGRTLNAWRSQKASQRAADLSVKDARDLVVQAVASAYLQIIATSARVDATKVQVETAQALYERARDQHRAGTSPAIDELRSQVELKTQQQQLLALQNQVAKDKLTLARAIGLPSGQAFEITDKAPYKPLESLTPEDALQRAYGSRADYQSAQAQVRAAELAHRSVSDEWLPTASLSTNYDLVGPTLDNSHGTFGITGSIKMNIFDGGKRRADMLDASTTIKQRREELANIQGQIDQDVRAALLDLKSAADQVAVAQDNVSLADQTLTQARDRFIAGVTDNIEVVQAQDSVAAADQNLISAIYAHNLAKVALARAMGATEANLKIFMGGK